MKKMLVLLALIALTSPSESHAAAKAIHSAGIGARFYQGHTSFTNQPFGDGDIAYNIGYEYREKGNPCFWQVVLGYAPSLDSELIDDVFTPELNLMLEEEHFRAGVGILDSFVNYRDISNEWSDLYYHLTVGLKQDLGSVSIAADALYAFDDWGNLGDFDFADLEYGVWLTYTFN